MPLIPSTSHCHAHCMEGARSRLLSREPSQLASAFRSSPHSQLATRLTVRLPVKRAGAPPPRSRRCPTSSLSHVVFVPRLRRPRRACTVLFAFTADSTSPHREPSPRAILEPPLNVNATPRVETPLIASPLRLFPSSRALGACSPHREFLDPASPHEVLLSRRASRRARRLDVSRPVAAARPSERGAA